MNEGCPTLVSPPFGENRLGFRLGPAVQLRTRVRSGPVDSLAAKIPALSLQKTERRGRDIRGLYTALRTCRRIASGSRCISSPAVAGPRLWFPKTTIVRERPGAAI